MMKYHFILHQHTCFYSWVNCNSWEFTWQWCYHLACASDPDFPRTVRVLFEYGVVRQDYSNEWKIHGKPSKFRYQSDTHTVMLIFWAKQLPLNTQIMNVHPGGMQPVMRDTMWARRIQKMVDSNGLQKDLKEHGFNTANMWKQTIIVQVVLPNSEDLIFVQKKNNNKKNSFALSTWRESFPPQIPLWAESNREDLGTSKGAHMNIHKRYCLAWEAIWIQHSVQYLW